MNRRYFVKGSAIIGLSIVASTNLLGGSGMLSTKSYRRVYRILNSDRTKVGTLPILRAFAGNHTDYVSPYVMLDEFGPVNLNAGDDPLRVDAHPHAGVTPTTYFINGSGHHKDSLNYDFQIGKGDFMMFQSGKGAIHMEETGQKLYEEGGIYHGFQIWLNMPSEYKFINPSTSVSDKKSMGLINEKDFTAKIVLGDWGKEKSDIELLSPAFYYDVEMTSDCRLDIPTEPTHNAFIYVIEGELEVEGQRTLKKNQLCLYERGESLINLYARDKARVLVLGGQPLNEVVYSYGPFVMNNEEQIKRVISDYRLGKMGDPEIVNR